jgi:carboxynorspermidine decarboxylase
METGRFQRVLAGVKTPCYIVDEALIEKNLMILREVRERTGCKVLLALKAFSMGSTFPLIRRYLDGVCASGALEARLGREEFGKEVHTFGSAYDEEGMKEISKYSDYVIFNSFSQLERFRDKVRGKKIGLRVNPGYSEVKTAMYNPCAPGSRLGITPEGMRGRSLEGISGLHFHTMCEQGADTLKRTIPHFERKFGKYLPGMEWVNFGGGHHITRPGYDLDLLVKLVDDFKKKYGVQVILEPGEAVALNAGVLAASVLDVVENGKVKVAILDTSAETHMPDVLAMPYRPEVFDGGKPNEKKHTYRLAGMSCLAGDVIGDYSFDKPLAVGDKLMFLDMAHYSMVKNTTFNGVKLPSIALLEKGGRLRIIRKFGYKDFRDRL